MPITSNRHASSGLRLGEWTAPPFSEGVYAWQMDHAAGFRVGLLRFLADNEMGSPLLVDGNDTSERGFKSGSPELVDAAADFDKQPIIFWFHLISAALHAGTSNTLKLTEAFNKEMIDHHDEDLTSLIRRLPSGRRRVLLIDGIETAFRGRQINRFVDGLFAALLAADADPRLRELIDFRVFLRADMIGTVQNIEQQISGKAIRLSWDTKTILNFVVSRIEESPWFQQHFTVAITEMRKRKDEVLRGQLSIEECEDLLLLVFPTKLRRNNLFTKTFLKTYFADSASERVGMESSLRYYPRIYAQFIEYISDPRKMPPGSFTGSQIDQGRVDQRLIFAAHDAAANDYLEQIKAELVYLLEFDSDITENAQSVNAFLAAFNRNANAVRDRRYSRSTK